ncbi:hypothetical protein S83_039083 [Arachis hypogaea]|nr:uncharacterized protein DS421_12g370820 [Arachis hypogaea]
MGTRDTPDYYCVFDGWVPWIYTSLSELHEQINEYEDCCWKKYTTLPKAEQAWLSYFGTGDLQEGKRRIMNGEAPDAIEMDDFREKQKIALK